MRLKIPGTRGAAQVDVYGTHVAGIAKRIDQSDAKLTAAAGAGRAFRPPVLNNVHPVITAIEKKRMVVCGAREESDLLVVTNAHCEFLLAACAPADGDGGVHAAIE